MTLEPLDYRGTEEEGNIYRHPTGFPGSSFFFLSRGYLLELWAVEKQQVWIERLREEHLWDPLNMRAGEGRIKHVFD